MRDGDVYVVNGQKIWTSLAQIAKFGILIARTDTDVVEAPRHLVLHHPDGPARHRGAPDPQHDRRGAGFNEVFFTDVRVPAENLIGEENLGWGMAKTTLANERVSLSTGGGLQWGYGPSARDLVAARARQRRARRRGAAPAARRRVHRGRDPALPPHAA